MNTDNKAQLKIASGKLPLSIFNSVLFFVPFVFFVVKNCIYLRLKNETENKVNHG